jgi:hypothetical protein
MRGEPRIRIEQLSAQWLPRRDYWVIVKIGTALLGLLGYLAQFNWLIRRHVNLLVSYARN